MNFNTSFENGKYDSKINNVTKKIIIIRKIANELLTPVIIGIDKKIPKIAFLEVVKIIAKVKNNKKISDKDFFKILFLFININPKLNGHIADNQVPV